MIHLRRSDREGTTGRGCICSGCFCNGKFVWSNIHSSDSRDVCPSLVVNVGQSMVEVHAIF